MALNNLITIVVYLHNSEKYIKRTINTILNSSYKDLEVIVINDASTDNSLHIVESLLSLDDRLLIVKQKEKIGLGRSFNLGIEQAKGNYILFIDINDTIPDDAIEKLYTAKEELQADVIIGTVNFYNEEKNLFEISNPLAYTSLKKYENKLIPSNYLQYNIVNINLIAYGKLYKTKFLKDNNITFSQINGYEYVRFSYLLLFAKNTKIAFIDEEVYSYHFIDTRPLYPLNIEIFDSYEEIKQLAQDSKDEIFLQNTKKYLNISCQRYIEKSFNTPVPFYFFKIARKYLLSGELSNLDKKYNAYIKSMRKNPLLAYYRTNLDKKVIKEIINSNALSRKLFNIMKALLS